LIGQKLKVHPKSQSIDEYSTMSNDINANFCGVVRKDTWCPTIDVASWTGDARVGEI
jgi:hypothetical protein